MTNVTWRSRSRFPERVRRAGGPASCAGWGRWEWLDGRGRCRARADGLSGSSDAMPFVARRSRVTQDRRRRR